MKRVRKGKAKDTKDRAGGEVKRQGGGLPRAQMGRELGRLIRRYITMGQHMQGSHRLGKIKFPDFSR